MVTFPIPVISLIRKSLENTLNSGFKAHFYWVFKVQIINDLITFITYGYLKLVSKVVSTLYRTITNYPQFYVVQRVLCLENVYISFLWSNRLNVRQLS